MPLIQLAENLWHTPHAFKANGLPITTRMTVVRLAGGRLWLHSPVPMDAALRQEIAGLGTVSYIVAPNKAHHLYVTGCSALFPQAQVFGAPGLQAKRKDIKNLLELPPATPPQWQPELEQVFFGGMPAVNETVWFHPPSKTLILTDLCQYWQGNLPWAVDLFASITDVRKQFAVPRTVRLLVRDRRAAKSSAEAVLQWPFERVVCAHNSIVDTNAHSVVRNAFRVFG